MKKSFTERIVKAFRGFSFTVMETKIIWKAAEEDLNISHKRDFGRFQLVLWTNWSAHCGAAKGVLIKVVSIISPTINLVL